MSLPALCTLRRARIGLLLAALSLLSACAMVRLAYNNADTVLRVMAQDYFDLWTEDNTELRQQIARLHEWHRREELPGYANLMQAASAKVAAGIDKADIEWVAAKGREHYRSFVVRAAEEAAPLAPSATPSSFLPCSLSALPALPPALLGFCFFLPSMLLSCFL